MIAQVEKLLRECQLGVLCTASENKPHCALMTYMLGAEPSMLYMVASINSKKFQNMLTSPAVSLLVDSRSGLGSDTEKIFAVTLAGRYQPIEQASLAEIQKTFAKMHPELAEIISSPSSVLFAIKLQSFLLLAGPVDAYSGDFS